MEATGYSPSITRSPITLWVEDNLTKQYLLKVWQDEGSLIDIRLGGGKDVIKGIVHDQWEQGHRKTFGFADRDFSRPNQDRWNNPASKIRVFYPEVHEIENYLLDWEAMEGCEVNQDRHSRNDEEIETRAKQCAEKMQWWMACKDIRSFLRNRLIQGYPVDPKIEDITSKKDAENYLIDNPWCNDFPANSAHIQDRDLLGTELDDAYEMHMREIDNDSWIKTYSGKEIFRHLRGWIYDIPAGSPSSKDEDFAKSIGEWQFTNNRVPPALIVLKNALKRRVGI